MFDYDNGIPVISKSLQDLEELLPDHVLGDVRTAAVEVERKREASRQRDKAKVSEALIPVPDSEPRRGMGPVVSADAVLAAPPLERSGQAVAGDTGGLDNTALDAGVATNVTWSVWLAGWSDAGGVPPTATGPR